MKRVRLCSVSSMPATRVVMTVAAALLSACTVGPDYQKPHTDAPPEWRTDSYWRVGQPSHAPLALNWWSMIGDPTLGTLEIQALNQNQTLVAALAHYGQARATLANTSAQRLPELDLGGSAERLKISKNRPVTSYTRPPSPRCKMAC